MNDIYLTQPTFSYNCGGYALKTFDWYRPYIGSPEKMESLIDKMVQTGMKKSDVEEILLDYFESKMLNEFPKMRRLKQIEDATNDEDVIAFRITLSISYSQSLKMNFLDNWDFHFMLKIDNEWFEKLGWENIRKHKNNINDVWMGNDDENTDDGYSFRYDSKIRYYAKKF